MAIAIVRLAVVLIAFGIVMVSYRSALSTLPPPPASTKSDTLISVPSEIPGPTSTTDLLQGYQTAYRESLGYFEDVPEHHWLLRRKIAQKRIHLTTDNKQTQAYYQNNWNPDFSCDMEDYVGRRGSTGKWVCDPHRLNRPGCLVYTVGSRSGYYFEKHLSEIAPLCEIHTFDYKDLSAEYASKNLTNGQFHPWGIADEGGYFFTELKHGMLARDKFKTLTQSMDELGHTGRTLNVLVMVCEMCEFAAYSEWLQVDIRQLLLKVHFINPNTTSMFQAIHDAGYATFHKEPCLNRGGRHIEFAFLKLAKSFFQNKHF